MNAFLRSVINIPADHYSTSGFSSVGSPFTEEEMEKAIKEFGATVIEHPE